MVSPQRLMSLDSALFAGRSGGEQMAKSFDRNHLG
jgi:hypothetical protein